VRNLKYAAAAAAFATAAAFAGSSQAAHLVQWTVSNGTFDDGGTFSGTFTVDPGADTVTTWNLTTSTDGPFGFNYSPDVLSSAHDVGGHPVFQFLFFFGERLELTNIPFGGSGLVPVLAGSETTACFICGPTPPLTRVITGGQAFGAVVPEPASWALMTLGAGLAGAMLRRRRAAATAQA
jgi:hypothetical protein